MTYNGYPSEEAFIEACRASARKYNELRNRIGERFREAQDEAYESWSEWDEAMGAEDVEIDILEEEVSGPTIEDEVIALRRQREEEGEEEVQQDELEAAPFDFALAASEHRDADTIKDAIPEEDLVEIDTLDIDGTEYTALANGQGDVFLHPCPDTSFISLHLGEDSYTVRHRERDGEKYCFVVNLDQGELESILGRQRKDRNKVPITFEK